MRQIRMMALTMLLCSAVLTGCSDDRELRSDMHISFAPYTGLVTRSAQTDLTNENFNSFSVTALGNNAVYFTEQTFSKQSSGNFESASDFFWPNFELNFCAYNKPDNGTFAASVTDGEGNQYITYTVPDGIGSQSDLVAAYKSVPAEETPTTGVCELTFSHYLTEVIVKAKISNPNYQVDVYGVRLGCMAGSGKYTFKNNTMTATGSELNSSSSKTYTSEYSTKKTLAAEAQSVMTEGSNGMWYLIPQTVRPWRQSKNKNNTTAGDAASGNEPYGSYIGLKVRITTNGGTCNIYPFTGSSPAWMAVPVPDELMFIQGKKYIVTLNFFGAEGAGFVAPTEPSTQLPGTGEPIVKQGKKISFTSSLTDWDVVEVGIDL